MEVGLSSNMEGEAVQTKNESTYITVAPAEDIDRVLKSSIFSLNKVEEIQKPTKEEEKKPSDVKADTRPLLLLMCLLTFEADYPEAFYDALHKSNAMKKLITLLKTKELATVSIQDMC